MLETIRETREFVFDLHIVYFDERDPGRHGLRDNLKFNIVNPPSNQKVFLETFKVDFDSDWADDKPAFIHILDESAPVLTRPFTGFTEWFAPEEQIEKFNLEFGPKAKIWYSFSRILVEVDSEYEWDFEDEENLSNFDESIKDPIFESINFSFGDLKASYFLINPYEFN